MNQPDLTLGAHGPGRPLRHRARMALRRASSQRRLLPSFLIIGAQRSGTTSLHRYLAQHPEIAPPIRKEIHYFSTGYEAGPSWYRAHFPLDFGGRSTFESTPDYLFDPRAPQRAHATLPDLRLIALLRNPVERAYSHYLLNVSLGHETLSFHDALEAEPQRLADDHLHCDDGQDPRMAKHRYSYTARGLYADQLRRWLVYFRRDVIYVTAAERMYGGPDQVLSEIETFLGLQQWQPAEFENWSYRTSPSRDPMPEGARQMLDDLFRGPNKELAELIEYDPGWK